MNFYHNNHEHYGGIDLHASSLMAHVACSHSHMPPNHAIWDQVRRRVHPR